MSELKQSLRLAPITAKSATALLERHHPLGRGRAFSLAFGIFWEGKCEGVMSWGAPITNNAVWSYGLRQDQALELRKMWLSDVPPRNAESRALSVACRLIGKHYPRLRLLLTYCDGDEKAAAYKAAGWIAQKAHRYLREVVLPDGRTLSLRDFNRKGGKRSFGTNWKGIFVYRRKWVYLLDHSLAPVVKSITPLDQRGVGGSHPTQALHSSAP